MTRSPLIGKLIWERASFELGGITILVVVLQRTSKKCPKIYNARAQPMCTN